MQTNNAGFTLIELLVVVLIIGILASIALPQYQKAVVKSRFSEAFMNLRNIGKAVELCELENGTSGRFSNDVCNFSTLAISVGEVDHDTVHAQTKNFEYVVYNVDGEDDILATADYVDGGHNNANSSDVCLCLFRDGSIRGVPGNCYREPSWDILRAIKVDPATGADNCNCC